MKGAKSHQTAFTALLGWRYAPHRPGRPLALRGIFIGGRRSGTCQSLIAHLLVEAMLGVAHVSVSRASNCQDSGGGYVAACLITIPPDLPSIGHGISAWNGPGRAIGSTDQVDCRHKGEHRTRPS